MDNIVYVQILFLHPVSHGQVMPLIPLPVVRRGGTKKCLKTV